MSHHTNIQVDPFQRRVLLGRCELHTIKGISFAIDVSPYGSVKSMLAAYLAERPVLASEAWNHKSSLTILETRVRP